MPRLTSYRDLGCLVTGASAGIGREIARLLAPEGARVVITARREDRLEALSVEMREAGAAAVFPIVADLADPEAPARLYESARSCLGRVDVLVNNAGFAVPGRFAGSDVDRTRAMLQVNVTAATELMRRALPSMVESGTGGVLNVSSVAAFQAAPFQSGYAGTKSFLLNLSESVHQEVKRAGVVVTALCPGVTDTEFFEAAGYRHLGRVTGRRMSAERVARVGLRALRRGKMTAIPGLGNRTLVFVQRLLPRWLVAEMSRRVLGGRQVQARSRGRA